MSKLYVVHTGSPVELVTFDADEAQEVASQTRKIVTECDIQIERTFEEIVDEFPVKLIPVHNEDWSVEVKGCPVCDADLEVEINLHHVGAVVDTIITCGNCKSSFEYGYTQSVDVGFRQV